MTRKEMKAWVAALRSGKYKQGTGRLRGKDDTYCCLGVKCDVEDNTKWVASEELNVYLWNGRTAYLPSDQNEAMVRHSINGDYLVKMNDDMKKTFPEIADYIEANYRPDRSIRGLVCAIKSWFRGKS